MSTLIEDEHPAHAHVDVVTLVTLDDREAKTEIILQQKLEPS
jgi:hypothetical protein